MRTRIIFPAALAALALAATGAPAKEGGRPLTTTLTGAAEEPTDGDPDGRGTATVRVNPGQRQICYEINVTGIEPATLAHIHKAPPTAAGPAVVTLEPPTDGSSSGCVENVDRTLLQEIIRNPGDYYINVHNAPYPAGALRGQLGR